MRCYMFLLCITITHEYKPFIFLSFLDSFRICKDPELPRSVFGAFSIPRYTSASVYPVLLASMHVEGAIAARGTLSEFAQKHTMPAHTICELQRHHLQDSICHLLQSTPKYSKVLDTRRTRYESWHDPTWSTWWSARYSHIMHILHMALVQQCHCSSWGQEMSGFTKATKAFTQASDALLAWNSEFHR